MKKILISSGILLYSAVGMATPRSLQQAQQIAESFVGSAIAFNRGSQTNLNVAKAKTRGTGKQEEPYYIFNREDGNGFVIVSADDDFQDILGYSTSGSFSADNMPDGLKCWLETLEAEMEAAKPFMAQARASRAEENTSGGQGDIAPLIKTTWDQGVPYNNKIPVQSTLYSNGKAATGCVATAMAQVMKYWQWPTGYLSGMYTNTNMPSAGTNLSLRKYTWSSMPEHYGEYSSNGDGTLDTIATYSNKAADEVAKLMYDCGVLCNMKWGDSSSAENIRPLYVLTTNYKYNKYMHAEARDVYSHREFRDILLNELNNGRPMLYWAKNKNGYGHYFICDGFDSATGMFHFNWGWSGMYDGYYALSALTPSAPDGSLSGFGSFNYEQFACVGCQPETEGEYVPVFTATSMSLEEPEYGYSATLTINNLSNSSLNFKGDLGVALIRNGKIESCNYDETLDKLKSSEFFETITVKTPKLNLANGEYTLCVIAKMNDDNFYIVKATYGTPYMWNININPETQSLIATPIIEKDDLPDDIETPATSSPIKGIDYFTLKGEKVSYPHNVGIFIKKTTYVDGSTKAEKVRK